MSIDAQIALTIEGLVAIILFFSLRWIWRKLRGNKPNLRPKDIKRRIAPPDGWSYMGPRPKDIPHEPLSTDAKQQEPKVEQPISLGRIPGRGKHP